MSEEYRVEEDRLFHVEHLSTPPSKDMVDSQSPSSDESSTALGAMDVVSQACPIPMIQIRRED